MNPSNMNPSNLPEEIFDWISQFPFSELPAENQNKVLQLMTEEEYDDLRSTVFAFQQADAQVPTSDSQVPEWSDKQFTSSRFDSLKKILHYQIPAYQVAACFLFLLGAFLLFNQFNADAPSQAIEKKVGVSISQDEYPTDLIFEL